MNKLFVAVLVIAAICIAEAKISKRSAVRAMAHQNKMKRDIGMQDNDLDLCNLSPAIMKQMPANAITVCDENEPSGKYCILSAWVCDNDQDCFDNSDETNCPRNANNINVN